MDATVQASDTLQIAKRISFHQVLGELQSVMRSKQELWSLPFPMNDDGKALYC